MRQRVGRRGREGERQREREKERGEEIRAEYGDFSARSGNDWY